MTVLLTAGVSRHPDTMKRIQTKPSTRRKRHTQHRLNVQETDNSGRPITTATTQIPHHTPTNATCGAESQLDAAR